MSFYELRACIDGYVKAHGSEGRKPDPITAEEHDELCEKYAHLDT